MEEHFIEYNFVKFEIESIEQEKGFAREDFIHNNLVVDAYGIPIGKTIDDVRKREQIINTFFHDRQFSSSENRIYNHAIKDYIYIKGISVIEAKEHSAKSYESTRAVLIIDEVLENALPVGRVPVKQGDKNQKPFSYMLIMVYRHAEIGTIKLTVGVKESLQRIEYGISALRPGEPLITKRNNKRSSKK